MRIHVLLLGVRNFRFPCLGWWNSLDDAVGIVGMDLNVLQATHINKHRFRVWRSAQLFATQSIPTLHHQIPTGGPKSVGNEDQWYYFLGYPNYLIIPLVLVPCIQEGPSSVKLGSVKNQAVKPSGCATDARWLQAKYNQWQICSYIKSGYSRSSLSHNHKNLPLSSRSRAEVASWW